MKTPNGKQVQPGYNFKNGVYISFLILEKNRKTNRPYFFSANTESAYAKTPWEEPSQMPEADLELQKCHLTSK